MHKMSIMTMPENVLLDEIGAPARLADGFDLGADRFFFGIQLLFK